MGSTNDPLYYLCPQCGRETFWLTSGVGAPGSYGYHCNSCGKLAKEGDEIHAALNKQIEDSKAK